jgi:hypothetical protein
MSLLVLVSFYSFIYGTEIYLSSLQTPQTGGSATGYKVGGGGVSMRLKWPKREAGHLHPFSAEVKRG